MLFLLLSLATVIDRRLQFFCHLASLPSLPQLLFCFLMVNVQDRKTLNSFCAWVHVYTDLHNWCSSFNTENSLMAPKLEAIVEQQSNEKMHLQLLSPKIEGSNLCNNVSYCFTLNLGLSINLLSVQFKKKKKSLKNMKKILSFLQ